MDDDEPEYKLRASVGAYRKGQEAMSEKKIHAAVALCRVEQAVEQLLKAHSDLRQALPMDHPAHAQTDDAALAARRAAQLIIEGAKRLP